MTQCVKRPWTRAVVEGPVDFLGPHPQKVQPMSAPAVKGAVHLAPKGADFDAHAPERARSSAFSAARVDLQKRLVAWGRDVAARLGGLGLTGQVSVTDAHPSGKNGHRVDRQSLVLAVKGRRGAHVQLTVDAESMEVCLLIDGAEELDAIDDAVPTPARASRVAAALAALPEQLEVGLLDPWTRVEAPTITELRALARRARETSHPIGVRWLVPRDIALAHSASIGESLADAAVALGALLRALGGAGTEPSRATKKSAAREFQKGAHVRALEGPFNGRKGVVQELDGRGGARVLFGLLAVHVDLADLAPALPGGGRPVLGTSHRKLRS